MSTCVGPSCWRSSSFLTALSQRFNIRNVRLGIIGTALLVLAYSIVILETIGD